jgi:hypothetical protein
VLEFVLQAIAVNEYAENGVDRVYLEFYIAIIGLNSVSTILLVLPSYRKKTANLASPRERARRERLILTLDVICDAMYSVFPTIYLVLMFLRTFSGVDENGNAAHPVCVDLRVHDRQVCSDLNGKHG